MKCLTLTLFTDHRPFRYVPGFFVVNKNTLIQTSFLNAILLVCSRRCLPALMGPLLTDTSFETPPYFLALTNSGF